MSDEGWQTVVLWWGNRLHEGDDQQQVRLGFMHVVGWREQGLRRCVQIALWPASC